MRRKDEEEDEDDEDFDGEKAAKDEVEDYGPEASPDEEEGGSS